MRQALLAVAFALTPLPATAQGVDPLEAKIETRDAERFAALFRETGGEPTAAQLQARYLDGAGRGVAIFTEGRIENADNLAKAVAADKPRYAYAIETCLPLIAGLSGEMRATYLAYRGLLPDRPLPAIHIVFGAANSGGTAKADAQVLGLEVMCGPGTTPDQFRAAMRAMFAHETVHSWQPVDPDPRVHRDPLLFLALREGVPDLLASLVTGTVPGPERDRWAREREAWLWAEFLKDRATVIKGAQGPWKLDEAGNKAVGRWIANYGRAPEGWPFEAGYWVGMRIAEAYLAQATDKRAALNELIELRDPAAILAAGGYRGD